MLFSYFFHGIHCKLVMVNCNICTLKYWCHLMLCRCNLIMLCLSRYTIFPKLHIKVVHKCCNSWLYGTKVMILHFLSLWSRCTKKCPSAENQILSLIIKLFIYKKIFLFWTNCC